MFLVVYQSWVQISDMLGWYGIHLLETIFKPNIFDHINLKIIYAEASGLEGVS